MDNNTSMIGTPLLSPEELRVLEEIGNPISYTVNSVLFGEGEETKFALLIRKGLVRVQTGSPARIVAIRGAGEMVGEMAAARHRPRSASVFAMTEVDALHLPAGLWLQFLYDHPRAMHAQLVAAEERLEEATRKSVDSFLGVEQRLAKVLVEFEAKGAGTVIDGRFAVQLSQRELADVVGASRESVVQVIRALKGREVVSTGRQATIIEDLEALRSIARGELTASP
ncbi:Crp/Fnr family transcriptional regulator [Kitasatospora purpeofusca]|uniref:Crp/Fnr family transcriptional regulator n=1 Tax=Kitasatospora purpeofusca TaxID=67352 RepID=UPI00368B265E